MREFAVQVGSALFLKQNRSACSSQSAGPRQAWLAALEHGGAGCPWGWQAGGDGLGARVRRQAGMVCHCYHGQRPRGGQRGWCGGPGGCLGGILESTMVWDCFLQRPRCVTPRWAPRSSGLIAPGAGGPHRGDAPPWRLKRCPSWRVSRDGAAGDAPTGDAVVLKRDGEVKRCRLGREEKRARGWGGRRGTAGAAACVNVPPLIVLRLYSPGLDGTDLEILIREQSPRLPSVTQLELLRGAFVP